MPETSSVSDSEVRTGVNRCRCTFGIGSRAASCGLRLRALGLPLLVAEAPCGSIAAGRGPQAQCTSRPVYSFSPVSSPLRPSTDPITGTRRRISTPVLAGVGPERLRVALVCDWFLPRVGGLELHLRDLA